MLRIPPRGFDDPRFDGLGDDDRIHVLCYWVEPLDDATLDRVGEVASTWLRDAALWKKARSPGVAWVYQTRLTSAGLMFTLCHVRNGRAPLVALEARLAAIGVEPRERIAGVVRYVDGVGEISVAPKGTKYPPLATTMQQFWTQCFDPNRPPPDCERDDECRERFAEHRMGRLEIPGLRLCYTTPTPFFLDGDPRCAEVGKALRATIAHQFGALAHPWPRSEPQRTPAAIPAPRDRAGKPSPKLERIYRLGRAGYSFAITADQLRVDILRDDHDRPESFRYREHELFTAVAAAIAKLDLEPVALWRRFGGQHGLDHLEIQLWEKPGSKTSKAVRAKLDGRREALVRAGELAPLPVHDAPPEPAGWRPANRLGAGAVELPGPGALRLALVPDARGRDALVVVGGKGAPRKVRAPASAYYRDLDRVAYSIDGAHALLATPCVLRVIDLAKAKAHDVMLGSGYQQVVALADGLALIRGALGAHALDPEDADTKRVWKQRGQKVTDGSRAEVEPMLHLVDTRDSTVVANIPCRAGGLASLAGGRVVAIWTPHEPAWRTAILALKGKKLGLVTTMTEALPGLREHDGRAISSNTVELVNVEAALAVKPRSLAGIAPD